MIKKLLKKYIASIVILLVLVANISPVLGANEPTLNPFSPDFKLSICDGPEGGRYIQPDGTYNKDRPNSEYRVCDFNGLMEQAQFLMNAMIVLGTLMAIVSITYSGYLYMTGNPRNISEAKTVFKYVGTGFLMMLTAWFIIYQILDWLQVGNGAKALLGNP